MGAIFLAILAAALGAASASAEPTVIWAPLSRAPAPQQGTAPATQQTSDQRNAKPSDYEKFYRESFRKQTIKSCIASAAKATAAGFDVTPTCACAADVFLRSMTLEQLIKTNAHAIPKADAADITAECVEKAPPVRRSSKR